MEEKDLTEYQASYCWHQGEKPNYLQKYEEIVSSKMTQESAEESTCEESVAGQFS